MANNLRTYISFRAIAVGIGLSVALLAGAKWALDDRAFKASLPDAAYGIARAIDRKDAEEFVLWTAAEDRNRFGLTPQKAKILLDWYHQTGASTTGLITFGGRPAAPRTYLEFASAEINPVTGSAVSLTFQDSPRGYRCLPVSTLLREGLYAQIPVKGLKSSEVLRQGASVVHREAPRLREMGFFGLKDGARYLSWDEYEKSLLEVADIESRRGK